MGRNKPRTTVKRNGLQRQKVCGCCGYINCDPMYGFPQTIALRKIEHRKRNKLCIGCGNDPCTCKNKGRE